MIRRTTTTERQLELFDPSDIAAEPTSDVPPDLDALFAELNDRFFDGRLEARLEWSTRLTASAANCRPEERLIRKKMRSSFETLGQQAQR